jgi:hypothetical protein
MKTDTNIPGLTKLLREQQDQRMFVECGLMLFALITFLGFWAFNILQEASKPHPYRYYTAEDIYGDGPTTEWDP